MNKTEILNALTGAQSETSARKLSEYETGSSQSIAIGSEIKILTAQYTRDGSDLRIEDESGDFVLVKSYFTHPVPDLISEGGAVLEGSLVSRLAGPGPVAQAGNAASDASTVIGEVTSLSGVVNVRHADGTADTLVEGASVFAGDILTTEGDGNFAITFADDTQFTMGPNGRAVLDDLIYNPSGGNGNSMGISLLQGAFSLVSGKIAKEDPESVSIKTPVGTIGIRGTSWSGKILQQGEESAFTLFTGAIIVANEGGSQLLTVPNQTVVLTSNFIAPSPPVVLTEGQLVDLYGPVLNLINPHWFKDDDEDFDPSKINPEAGPRGQNGDGGGASFAEFAGGDGTGGLQISDILALSELLDRTDLELDETSGLTDIETAETPEAEIKVVPVTNPETSLVEGFTIQVILDAPATETVRIFYEIIPISATDQDTGIPGEPDYIDEGNGVLTLAPGESVSGFALVLIQDDVIEATETALIRLTGAEGAEINPAFSQALVVIEDDDIGIVSILPANADPLNNPGDSAETLAGFATFSSFSAFAAVVEGSDEEDSATASEEEGVVRFRFVLDKALGPGAEVEVHYTVTGDAAYRLGFEPGDIRTATFSGGENGQAAGSEIFIELPLLVNDEVDPNATFNIEIVGGSANMRPDESAGNLSFTIEEHIVPVEIGETEIGFVSEKGLPDETEDLSLGIEMGSGTLESVEFSFDQSDFDALALTSDNIPVTISGQGTSTLVGTAGEKPVFSATLNPDGTYSIDWVGAIDHLDGELSPLDSIEIPLSFTVRDVNGTEATGQLLVEVEDDAPEGVDDAIDIPVTALPSYNLVFVLDTSGSMGTVQIEQSDGTFKTRMEIMKDAVSALIEGYEGQSGELNITIIDFDGDAKLVFEGTSVEDAIDFVTNPFKLAPAGITNYRDALANTENGAEGVLREDIADPALEGYQHVVYFISDGEPYPAHNAVPIDENGVNAWQEFTEQNNVDVNSVGIGLEIDTFELAKVSNAGEDPLLVTEADELADLLIDTIPTVQEGSIISDAVSGDHLGADGAEVSMLNFKQLDAETAQFYEGQGGEISEGAGGTFTVSFDIPSDGSSLSLNLQGGGTFSMANDGTYRLEIPAGIPDVSAYIFEYVLEDGDGDTSAAELKFQFVEEPNIIQSDGNDSQAGTGAADTFVIAAAEEGSASLLGFDTAQDLLDLTDLFDSLGIEQADREQGEAWDLSAEGNLATLTISENMQKIVF
ncbi:MAG: VWA domain-containing protein, partial [Sneathiellales bacterium]|nr:VWA domain-containing protein [Sneathiellales bacterium]